MTTASAIDLSKLQAFYKTISQGFNLRQACAYAEIPYNAMASVLARGKQEEERIAAGSKLRKTFEDDLAIWQKYSKRRISFSKGMIENIIIAAEESGDWKAYQWILKTQRPNDFGTVREIGGGRNGDLEP